RTVAWRMTLLCALAMSGAAWLIYRIVLDEAGEPLPAMLAGWLFAFTAIAWTGATRTEVHALATLFMALTLLCALRWSRTQETRWLYGGAAAWALAIGTHPVALLLGVGLFGFLIYRWETVPARAFAGASVVFVVLCAALYAYLPIRSAQVYYERRDPTLTLGIQPGRPFWDYDHPAAPAGFEQLVSGSDFPVGEALAASMSPQTYAREGRRYVDALTDNFTFAGLVLALAGGVVFIRRQKLRAVAFIACGMFAAPFALGFPIESDISRYFLPSFVVCSALAGIAAAAFMRRWPVARYAVIAGFAVVVAAQLFFHAGLLGGRTDPGATAYIDYVRANTPPNAILLAPWTYATPLAYAAYVEHRMDGRIIETAWLSDDVDDLPRWMKTRPVYIVYLPWGDLPQGYRLVRLPGGDLPVYRVLKTRK
ncbi:MAG: DUF2723 domain-containing protein, partial [Candidatus Eremiobacteraeota bacterium]|nr:DUF2723 domain-containing protein [Candidatus Eremiobacteraeota bacterium]